MVKRIIFIVLSYLTLYSAPLSACDACGCSASNTGIGLLTDYRSNFVRFSYFDTRFQSNPKHGNSVISIDKFTQWDLSFRYAIGKNNRIRLIGHLPYGINTRENEAQTSSHKGIADARLIANYVLLRDKKIGSKARLYLEAGGGINIPTGKYDESLIEQNLPDNFNIGKGAWGYILQINSVVNINKGGFIVSGNYQVNDDTKAGYHFGNQLSTQLMGFYELSISKQKLIPNAGLSFEKTARDNYANDNNVPETGGKGLFFTSALNFKINKCLVGFSYAMPVIQDYSKGAVDAKERLSGHFNLYLLIFLNFTQMNKILLSTLFLALSLFLISCDKDDDTNVGVQTGSIEVEFDNVAIVDGVQRQLSLVTPGSDDYEYSNGMEQDFNINLLRYYITNIKLEGPNGEVFEDEVAVTASGTKGIYLIDESDLNTGLIKFENVPAGTYNKITFTVGVEENGVQEGAAGGVLDPATCNMFWNWNSGYIAMKFEGQSPVSNGGVSGSETLDASSENGILFHVGGWRTMEGTAFVYNNKTMTFDFDTNATVKEGEQPHVHMIFDVLSLFKGENMIDFTGNHNVHKPIDGVPVAENIPAAFSFDHIHQ